MSPANAEPALVYDRIAQNRRKTILLLALAIAAIVPFIVGVSYTAATLLAPVHHARPMRYAPQVDDPELQQRIETIVRDANRRMAAQIERENAENGPLRLRLMGLVAVALAAVLGLLFWGMTASPTSTVLSLCGARPAGASEAEAKRLLENLAIGAGLPPPRLYVIDTMATNAFAAGMEPAHSVVAVTQGLLALTDRRELEGVLAHELSHIGNRDTRLNTIVAAIALFLRLPYLLRRRRLRAQELGTGYSPMGRFRMYSIMLSPVYLYIFCIAPLLAALIRSAISRNREFLADADAALLTRYPEGLMRALAKIRGAGTVVTSSNPVLSHLYFADPSEAGLGIGLFTGNLLATHPPIDQRITRLVEFHEGVSVASIEEALHAGEEFTTHHPPLTTEIGLPGAVAQDELSALTAGNPMGRVFRVLGPEPAPVYDRADLKSRVLARIAPGGLLVVFDDPGVFRQVLTPDQTFGYLARSVKLGRIDLMPQEVFDPASRAAAEAAAAAKPAVKAAAAPLTTRQITIAAVFGLAVFAGILLVLAKFGGR